jgi:2-polyprenyl-3-methyl-5-hydroxy-6-metoxy-1,4-benzoquinol methylase
MAHYRLHPDPRSSHQQILRLLRRRAPRTVLDVGAAEGLLGRELAGSGMTLDAVEPNPQWAAAARAAYRQVYAGTVEQAGLAPGAYDAIVCADVLEHLVDPVAAILRLRAAAAPGAVFLISIPNIAHLAVRLMLLTGRFPAMERGPLDKTHLHFYTRTTAAHMLARAGLRLTAVHATAAPLDELWPRGQGTPLFRGLAAAQHAAVWVHPRLFGYQWLFEAQADGPCP